MFNFPMNGFILKILKVLKNEYKTVKLLEIIYNDYVLSLIINPSIVVINIKFAK